MDFINGRTKKLWDLWNLRVFILLSLALQTFLVLFAPSRKRTTNKFVILLIWSAYLLADWVANFCVGLISNGGDNDAAAPAAAPAPAAAIDAADDLKAFWAPFLLLHLGGPDTITAFALEDNELWLRHLLGLIFQVAAAAYVFFRTLPKNSFWIPTMLLFLAGIIKYSERTRALYLASLESFRESMLTEPDPGPNYAKLMEEYSSKKDAGLPSRIEMLPEPDKETTAANIDVKVGDLDDIEVVQHAYRYFKIFKGLIVDLIFSFRERNESRKFFLARTPEDAFRVIEVELNFIYEVLYTKVVVVHCLAGYVFRFLSFMTILVSLVLFYFKEKRDLNNIDVGITYTLLWGAITLDSIAFMMLVFSDWTVAGLKKKPWFWTVAILNNFLAIKKSERFRIFFRRWSGKVATYNLIEYCVKERPKRVNKVTGLLCLGYFSDMIKKGFHKSTEYLGLTAFLDDYYYVRNVKFTDELRTFIFDELHMKSEIAEYSETAKDISSARGDWVLRNNACGKFLRWIEDIEYDQSLLLWHIATELCYTTGNDNDHATDHCKFSKTLSDYMLYLLVMQPTMMSAVSGIGQIRFRDTCAEAKKFFGRGELEKGQSDACRNILNVNTDVKPVAVKGDRSKSVLFDACMLAKELNELEKVNKWEIMSKVWVEMLSYAASHCRANTHAQQVSKGGELVTFVWLLMAHFGLGEQFQITEGHARAKLIVGK